MKLFIHAFAVFLVIVATSRPSAAADKQDAIVGSWAPIKVDGKDVPKEITITVVFTKDGKASMKISVNGKEEVDEATYTVDGDKITIVKKSKEGKEDTDNLTMKSVATDSMVLINDKTKQEMEFKKK